MRVRRLRSSRDERRFWVRVPRKKPGHPHPHSINAARSGLFPRHAEIALGTACLHARYIDDQRRALTSGVVELLDLGGHFVDASSRLLIRRDAATALDDHGRTSLAVA